MSETGRILLSSDAEHLRSQGLLHLASTRGYRRLHKRRLNRSSDEEHQDVPLRVDIESPAACDAFATIPEVLISRETLRHVGLSETKSAELWYKWTNWPTSDDGFLILREADITFIDFIVGHTVESESDATGESDIEWRACMDACGIDIATQDAIMDPHFRDLRLSNSCLYWVKDTIEMRYAGLEDIQRASRVRDMQLQRTASRPGGHQSGEGGRIQGSHGDVSAASSLTTTGQERRSASGLQQRNMAGVSAQVWSSARALASQNAPGHTTLYKAMDQARMHGLFDDAGNLANIGTILSPPPSDFSSNRALFYFTLNVKVAEYYASFAKRRTSCESVIILCLRIPNIAIESLSEPDIRRLYWPSNDWKELVWRSRTGKTLPTRLRNYRDAILIIGTTARKPHSAYHTLSTWEDFPESYVLKVGGDIAIQYVISGEDEGCEWLIQNGAENMEAFPYTQAALDSWLEEN